VEQADSQLHVVGLAATTLAMMSPASASASTFGNHGRYAQPAQPDAMQPGRPAYGSGARSPALIATREDKAGRQALYRLVPSMAAALFLVVRSKTAEPVPRIESERYSERSG
jgi:hypothetical protein